MSTNKVLLAHGHTYSFTVVCGCFPRQRQRPCGLQSLKYLLSDLSHKKVADPCPKVELLDSSHPKASGKMRTFAQHTGINERCLLARVEEQHPAYLRPSSRHHSGQRLPSHLWPLDIDTLTWVRSSPAASCRCLKIRMFLVIY